MQNTNVMKWVFWMVIALLARLIPHAPNFTPYASLVLLMGCQLSRRTAIYVTLISLIVSDVILAMFLGYSIFGSWTFFTYSGFVAVAFGSYCLHQHRTVTRIASYALVSVTGYWVWTNFGTWLTGGLYPHSWSGLSACFVAGLPFLQMSTLAALIFVPVFFGGIILIERFYPQFKPQAI